MLVRVKITELLPAEYNPRKPMDHATRHKLKLSLQEFGMVDPIIANSHPTRKNIVIGGHQRLTVAQELGWEEVPVLYVPIEDIEKEKKLNINLNKISGAWDLNKLIQFNPDLLAAGGFNVKEINSIFKKNDKEKPEVEFTLELLEEHNFVVLVCDNEIDWTQACSVLKLDTVQALASKEGFKKAGIGRVLRWADAFRKIKQSY